MAPLVMGSLISGAASLLGGLFGSRSQDKANEQNAALARETMAFNAQQADVGREFSAGQFAAERRFNEGQAQENRRFQQQETEVQRAWSERMSATSYQRAVGDLSAAGLNPMLAYSQGGAPMPQASAPSGSMASVHGGSASSAAYGSAPVMQSKAIAALNSAGAVAQLANTVKTGENIEADTVLKKEQAAVQSSSAANVRASTERIVVGEIPKLRKELFLLQAQTDVEAAKYPLTQAQTLLTELNRMLLSGEIDKVRAQKALIEVEKKLADLRLPEAEAYSEKFKSEYGKTFTPYIREIVDMLRVLIYGRSVAR